MTKQDLGIGAGVVQLSAGRQVGRGEIRGGIHVEHVLPAVVVFDVAGADLPHGAHIENAIDPPDGVEICVGKGFGLELGEVGADDRRIRVVLRRPFLLRCLLTRLGDCEHVLGAESADLVVDVVGDAGADRAGDGQRERADEDGEHRQSGPCLAAQGVADRGGQHVGDLHANAPISSGSTSRPSLM